MWPEKKYFKTGELNIIDLAASSGELSGESGGWAYREAISDHHNMTLTTKL